MGVNSNRQPFALQDFGAGAGNVGRSTGDTDAVAVVTALYAANALGMGKLAYVMIGDREAADDIVQEAFSGLYRRWDHLSDPDKALSYVRSAVLNSCRSALRRRRPEISGGLAPGDAEHASAESVVLSEEERTMVLAALRKLPHRQREVLVLRFYLDMTEAEIAAEMGIGPSTVRSSAHRGLAALGHIIEEMS
jgi:RNA polymerase sigma-70 factor (sigma-E family)